MKARVSRHAGLRVVASALLAPWMVQATCVSVQAQSTPARGGPARPQAQPKATAEAQGQLNLQLRRQPGMLQVVVEGAGSAPELQQSSSGNAWQGLLVTNGNPGLRQGLQQFSAPEAGIESISLSGSGNRYQIDVRGLARMALPRPQVSADGLNLIVSFPTTGQAMSSTANFDLNRPGRLPQPSFAPPLQPRAVAPPVGDMAVGTMLLANTSFVRLSGPKITMTLRNAPAKDVLMSLARLGNYGYVFVEDSGPASASAAPAAGGSTQAGGTSPGSTSVQAGLPVNVSFINEDYSRAVNAVLMASGLAAKLEGRVLMVGSNIFSKSFGPKLSKVYRLNQVAPGSAADYLANLGASVTKTNTITTSVSQGTSESSAVSGAPASSTTQTATETLVEAYGASTGPLLGLQATTDSRLGTITLIGDPSLVVVAEQYLRQLDLRQRQVAVNVKILNIDLENDLGISNSFSAKLGNTFIVSDGGAVSVNFGNTAPAKTTTSTPVSVGVGYSQGQLLDAISMAVTNRNGKSLADPTLLVMEGEEATVSATTSVITDISTTDNANNTTTSTTSRSDAGLTLKVKSEKIDDNGFVTLTLKPEVSIPTPAGTVNVGGVATQIFNITQRSLQSGRIRLRDGQTLVLTGVIQESQLSTVTKWPIVGDLPFIGQFFRGSANKRTKNELVIVVTPRIIDDETGGRFGYGYRPASTDARQVITGSM